MEFLKLLAQNATPQSNTLEVETMRQNIEDIHEKGNAKISETFKGNLEEKTVKTKSTGKFSIRKKKLHLKI